MAHTSRELVEGFPGHADRIYDLKLADDHFAALAERCHTVNRTLHRMEERIEPVSDETERSTRRERLHLKVEIAGALELVMS